MGVKIFVNHSNMELVKKIQEKVPGDIGSIVSLAIKHYYESVFAETDDDFEGCKHTDVVTTEHGYLLCCQCGRINEGEYWQS